MTKLFLSLCMTTLSLHGMEVREWSLVDSCDVLDEALPALDQLDTLQQFLLDHTSESWNTVKDQLKPMIDQAGRKSSNNQVESPFIYAAKVGLIDFIKYVLEETKIVIHQALLDQALHGAVLYDHNDLALYLLDKNADPNGYSIVKINEYFGRTTLDVAFKDINGKYKEGEPDRALVAKLILKGADGSLCGNIDNKWHSYTRKHQNLDRLFILQRFFGTPLPTLQQLCIAHYATTLVKRSDEFWEKIEAFPLIKEELERVSNIRSMNRMITPSAPTLLSEEEFLRLNNHH